MMAMAATGIYLLLRYKRKRVVKYLIAAAVFFVAFFLLNWYSELYAAQLTARVDVYSFGWLGVTGALAALLVAGMYKGSEQIRLVSVTLIGSLTGTFLGAVSYTHLTLPTKRIV